MELENAIIFSIDFVLTENVDELYENLDEITDRFSKVHDTTENRAFYLSEEPEKVNENLSCFSSFKISVFEGYGVTQIISWGILKDDEIERAKEEFSDRNKFIPIMSHEHKITQVREYIPGETTDAETTVTLLEVDERIDVQNVKDVQRKFRSGEEEEFIHGFEASQSKGVMMFYKTIFFLGEVVKPFGRLVGIYDYPIPIEDSPDAITNYVSSISRYLSVRFWQERRLDQIEEIEEELDAIRKSHPGNRKDIDTHLAYNKDLYQIQMKWSKFKSLIPREVHVMRDSVDISSYGDYRGSSIEESSESEIFELELENLRPKVELLDKQYKQIDSNISAMSTYVSNHISAISSKKNLSLQESVENLTILLAGLTLLLVGDAITTGGLSTLVDRLFSEGVSGMTNQVWLGIAVLVLAGLYIKRRKKSNKDRTQ